MCSLLEECFMCTNTNNCSVVDDEIVAKVEYLLPEITIIRQSIPLRICFTCVHNLHCFNTFKQVSLENNQRLEARINKSQSDMVIKEQVGDIKSILQINTDNADNTKGETMTIETKDHDLIKEEIVEENTYDRDFYDSVIENIKVEECTADDTNWGYDNNSCTDYVDAEQDITKEVSDNCSKDNKINADCDKMQLTTENISPNSASSLLIPIPIEKMKTMPCRNNDNIINEKNDHIEQWNCNINNTFENCLYNIKCEIPSNKNTKKRIRGNIYCFYCESRVLNFPRHLKRNHNYESEVRKMLTFPAKSKERKDLLASLRKKGNYIDAVRKPERLIPNSKLVACLPCPDCFEFYAPSQLWRHRKICPENKKDTEDKNKNVDLKVQTKTTEKTSEAINIQAKKRRILVPWTKKQKDITKTFFANHLRCRKPPKRHECEALIEKYPEELQNKDWLKIKVFIQNVYTNKCI